MNEMGERRAATTVQELDIHLGYVQQNLARLIEAVAEMATKEDIRQLNDRMQSFATREELLELEKRLNALTLPSLFDRWASTVTKIGAVAAVVAAGAGAFAAVVHFIARMPK